MAGHRLSWDVLILAALLAAVVVTANNCSGNCPSGLCPGDTCPCGLTPRMIDIATFCAQNPQWNQTNCRCIVNAESGGNANAIDYEYWNQNFKVGLLQVPNFFWGSCNGGFPPCSLEAQLNCGQEMYKLSSNTWAMWDQTCVGCNACNSP